MDTCSINEVEAVAKCNVHSYDTNIPLCIGSKDIVSLEEPLYGNVQHSMVDYDGEDKFGICYGRTIPSTNVSSTDSILDKQCCAPVECIGNEEILSPEMYACNTNPYRYYEHGLQPPVKADTCRNEKTIEIESSANDKILSYPENQRNEMSLQKPKKETKVIWERSFIFPWEKRHDRQSSPHASPKKEKKNILLWSESKKNVSNNTGSLKFRKDLKSNQKRTKPKKVTKRSESEKYIDKSRNPNIARISCKSDNELMHKRSLSDDWGDQIFDCSEHNLNSSGTRSCEVSPRISQKDFIQEIDIESYFKSMSHSLTATDWADGKGFQ